MKIAFIALLIVTLILILVVSNINMHQHESQKLTWKEEIIKPEITQEEFTIAFAEAIQSQFPNSKVYIASPLVIDLTYDLREFKFWLHNAWARCANLPQIRIEICEGYIQGLRDTIKFRDEKDSRPDPNRIIPILKSNLYIENLPDQNDGTKPIFAEQLAGDILIVYGQLDGNTISFFDESNVRDLNSDMEKIRELSIKNLMAALGEIRRYGKGPLYMLKSKGIETSSLILIDKIWETEEARVQGELVAAVPYRDVVLFTGSESEEGLTQVRNTAEEFYNKEPYAISTTLIVRRNGKWAVFNEETNEK